MQHSGTVNLRLSPQLLLLPVVGDGHPEATITLWSSMASVTRDIFSDGLKQIAALDFAVARSSVPGQS